MAEASALPQPGEPSWFYPATRVLPVPASEAEAFLRQLDDEDRRLVVLVHGLRLDLGTVARALRIDPSIVSWRVRRALQLGAGAGDPAALERGLAALLGSRDAGDPAGAATRASGLVRQFPPDVRQRLADEERGAGEVAGGGTATAGLGIGSFVIILLVIAAFIVYGMIKDVNPLWRGEALARQGDFIKARRSLQELGSLPEARAWIALTWLAEGQFERGLEVLHEPGVAPYLGDFQPVEGALQGVEGDPSSGALLPRGVITDARPRFVFRAAPAGTLSLETQFQTRQGTRTVARSVELTDTRGPSSFAEIAFPSDWPALGNASALWTAPGEDAGDAAFTVLSGDERVEIMDHAKLWLQRIPSGARAFLRGHYYLRNRLYVQAGAIFAGLAEQFPEEAYPRARVEAIAAALAVDPAVLLR